MKRGAIEVGSQTHSRKYAWHHKTKFAKRLIRENLLWRWQLYYGDEKQPNRQTRPYQEMVECNAKFSREFLRDITERSSVRLSEWKILNKQEYYNKVRMLVEEIAREGILEDREAILKKITEVNEK